MQYRHFLDSGLLDFLDLSEKRTSDCWGESIRGVVKLGTCFKDSNVPYNSFSQLLEFPFRALVFTG